MSIRSLTKKGYSVVFEGDVAYVSLNGNRQFEAHLNGRLYEVVLHADQNVFAGFSGENKLNKFSQSLWHFRMGHLNAVDMKKMINQRMVDGLEQVRINTDSGFCESCVLGKQARTSFPKNKDTRSSRILELIHTDLCGPMPTTAHDDSRYFVSFMDDYSRASSIYFLKRKSDVFEKFKEYQAMAEAFHGVKIARLRADNGGEYILNEFKNYCKINGIQLTFTVPYNPEMNGVSERLNRTLQDKATTMLLASNLKHVFWNEAILTANYLKNRSITSAVGKQFLSKTPAGIWFNKKPNLSHLRIFGSECFNHIPKVNRSKFEQKSTKCLMLGYAVSMGSYRLWDSSKSKLVVGRHVTFNESSVLKCIKLIEMPDSEAVPNEDSCKIDRKDKAEQSNMENVSASDDDSFEDCDVNNGEMFHGTDLNGVGHSNSTVHDANTDCIGDNSGNIHGAKENCTGDDKDTINSANKDCTGNIDGIFSAHFALSAEQFVENDPNSINEAKTRDDLLKWKDAIQGEFKSLMKNNTWTVCDLPKGRKAVTNKRVFKLERKADGQIDKYKARLVARGFTQKLGFDYSETYAPVAKLVTLKILLSIASRMNMHIHQMDVKSAFLNGELSEDIYMELPFQARKHGV